MKNRINVMPFIAFSFGLAGTLIFMSSCSENKRTDANDMSKNDDMNQQSANEKLNNPSSDDKTILVIENNNDSIFLIKVAEMQLEEIRLGRLAQQKGSTPHVKELGKMMEDGHTKALASLETLARDNSVSIPSSTSSDSENALNELGQKTGNDFGKAYSKMMVDHHEDAIDLFENAAEDSESQQIRAWASSQLPTLRTHLEHAEACKVECEKM